MNELILSNTFFLIKGTSTFEVGANAHRSRSPKKKNIFLALVNVLSLQILSQH